MPVRLYWTTMAATEPPSHIGLVDLYIGDKPEDAAPTEWIRARVLVDEPNVKSLALLQIAALRKVRDLLTDESDRLGHIKQASDLSVRTLDHLSSPYVFSFCQSAYGACAAW
jgi:hypothetical protein